MIFRYISYLSIDVALGALAVGIFFWKILDRNIPFSWFIIFPFCVYGIYNLDHWFDIQSHQNIQENPRRNFHLNHKTFLEYSILISLFSSFIIATLFLPLELFLTGIGIGFLVILHLFILNSKKIDGIKLPTKELTIASIYTLGTAFPLIIPSNWQFLNQFHITNIIFLYSIVWNNLIVNSISDFNRDKIEGYSSLPLNLGLKISIALLSFSFVLGSILLVQWIFPYIHQHGPPYTILSINVLLFSLIFPFILLYASFQKLLKPDSIRILGEIPFILFFFA